MQESFLPKSQMDSRAQYVSTCINDDKLDYDVVTNAPQISVA